MDCSQSFQAVEPVITRNTSDMMFASQLARDFAKFAGKFHCLCVRIGKALKLQLKNLLLAIRALLKNTDSIDSVWQIVTHIDSYCDE